MAIELWQLDTIAVSNKMEALIALCEEQAAIIEDLRSDLKQAERERDGWESDFDDAEKERDDMEEERDVLERKLADVKKMLEEVDEDRCGLDYINSILELL